MLIEFSITLQPETSLEDAQRIREETLTSLRRYMRWQNQENAVIGSTLTADISETPQTGNVFVNHKVNETELMRQCAESDEGHIFSQGSHGKCTKCGLELKL